MAVAECGAAGGEVREGAGALARVVVRLRRAEAEQRRALELPSGVGDETAVVARGGDEEEGTSAGRPGNNGR